MIRRKVPECDFKKKSYLKTTSGNFSGASGVKSPPCNAECAPHPDREAKIPHAAAKPVHRHEESECHNQDPTQPKPSIN